MLGPHRPRPQRKRSSLKVGPHRRQPLLQAQSATREYSETPCPRTDMESRPLATEDTHWVARSRRFNPCQLSSCRVIMPFTSSKTPHNTSRPKEVDAETPVVSQALMKVVLLIQDLWSNGQYDTRTQQSQEKTNTLLSSSATGAVPCTTKSESSTLVFGPSIQLGLRTLRRTTHEDQNHGERKRKLRCIRTHHVVRLTLRRSNSRKNKLFCCPPQNPGQTSVLRKRWARTVPRRSLRCMRRSTTICVPNTCTKTGTACVHTSRRTDGDMWSKAMM